jgi:4-aminobutyrate aminotransferase
MKRPKIKTELPGKKSKELIRLDNEYISTSYTRSYPLVAHKGKGCWITDPDGNEFLDFAAGIATCSTGHCDPNVVKAIKDQAGKLIHMSGTDFYYEPQVELAAKLNGLITGVTYRTFFGNSGAESVEAAMKLSRWHTDRSLFIAFEGAFHGRTMGALSLTGSKSIQKQHFHPLVPQVYHFPYAYCYRCAYNLEYPFCDIYCVKRIEESFSKYIPAREVAAIFVEPIQGEGGYIVPPKEFHTKLSNLCNKYNILYVTDEVQSGMGRTGKMFAMEHFLASPSIICLAKGIASGMPLGVTMAPANIMKWSPGSHASTFGGNPISCRAALATIDLLEKHLIWNAEQAGNRLMLGLGNLQKDFECIGDVRGKGLMLAIELVKDRETKELDAELRDKIIDRCFKKGLLLLGCGPNSIRFTPPLTVNADEIDTCLNILEESLNELCK